MYTLTMEYDEILQEYNNDEFDLRSLSKTIFERKRKLKPKNI